LIYQGFPGNEAGNGLNAEWKRFYGRSFPQFGR